MKNAHECIVVTTSVVTHSDESHYYEEKTHIFRGE